MLHKLLPLALLLLTSTLHAENGRSDYDLDDDGLIEINDLQDLNEIRNHLDGAALYGSSDGCPVEGCVGFELTTDLDFDTNGDDVLDAADSFWNDGEGWSALGDYTNRFQAIFEGNGHTLSNLMINRPGSSYQGLFGYLRDAQIRNIALRGPLTSVTGRGYIGLLAGYATNSTLSQLIGNGDVTGISRDYYTGGLLGFANVVQLDTCVYAGNVSAQGPYVGGLMGVGNDSSISDCFASGRVSSKTTSRIGMLAGEFLSPENIAYRNLSTISGDAKDLFGDSYDSSSVSNYWQADSNDRIPGAASIGASLSELQCPVTADNTSCSNVTLFASWAEALTPEGEPRWDFGTAAQLPGVRINGVVYRDSDGDGALDSDDTYPNNPAASRDSDGDGAPDSWNPECDAACRNASGLVLDQVPQSAAAIVDNDLDGLPDAWAIGCDSICQSASGLTLDHYPDDTDNDGISNIEDTDDNNDGILDIDADSDGLIEIESWAELDAIRFSMEGVGQRFNIYDELDSSGCPTRVINGIATLGCNGYELINDLDFDTNGNGVLDADDSYWNDGEGWSAIGANDRFEAIFEGNGHVIYNLMVNRPSSSGQALFGSIKDAEIRNLGLTGELMRIEGLSAAGLVSYATSSTLHDVYATGLIVASRTSAGLVGILRGSHLSRCFSGGGVIVERYDGGGLFSSIDTNSSVSDCFSTTSVQGPQSGSLGSAVYDQSVVSRTFATGGGGYEQQFNPEEISFETEILLEANYWWTLSTERSSISAGTGASLSELQCPTTSDNNTCSAVTIYAGWSQALNEENPIWDFGTSEQLPGLVINGVLYRDSDGDGYLDEMDAFPSNVAAHTDSDSDGAPDSWVIACDDSCRAQSGLQLDSFPQNPAAVIDDDFDGFPDEWIENCDSDCQQTSGLILDVYINDTDNDGINNQEDTDDNGDGITDADADSDGLIDIENLEELHAVRFSTKGYGQRLTNVSELDVSGCPAAIRLGVQVNACNGYELLNNLNFDTNGDEQIDLEDAYWNEGEGWLPIGLNSEIGFSAIFNGNGFEIENLFINRPSEREIGLFSTTFNAQISNIIFSGSLMSVSGRFRVGAVAGTAFNSNISNVVTSGLVNASAGGGSLLGGLEYSTLSNCVAAGQVVADERAGGIVAFTEMGEIRDCLSTANLNVLDRVGSIATFNDEPSSITRVLATGGKTVSEPFHFEAEGSIHSIYWWTSDSFRSSGAEGTGASIKELQCGTSGSADSNCSSVGLYLNWNEQLTEDGQAVWDFGSSTQLPGININGIIYRDSDGDGLLDEQDSDDDDDGVQDADDAFPTDASETTDTDSDGVGDNSDPFPEDPTEWLDTDGDGLGNNTDLDDDNDGVMDEEDAFPIDPTETADTDNDGVGDNSDAFPNEASETVDTDGDGTGDNADVFPTDPTETTDTDGDGIGNNTDTDDDNDGVPDAEDAELGPDNGLPVVSAIPDNITLFDNGQPVMVTLLVTEVAANDAADANPEIIALLNSEPVELDGDTQIEVPCGSNTVEWMAEDAAGNRSEPLTQTILVYPSLSFAETSMISGENNQAGVMVSLSCASPSYPVTVTLDLVANSTSANNEDFEDLQMPFELVFSEGTSQSLELNVLDDQTLESDEVLTLAMTGNSVEVDGEQTALQVVESQGITQLIITDTNLAPEVTIVLTQANVPVDVVDSTEGEVTVRAEVIDPNGNDTHSFNWALSELGLAVDSNESSFSFDPNSLQDGDYTFSVTVIDSGEPALSDTEESVLIIETPTPEPTAVPTAEPSNNNSGGSSSGGGGGGSTGLWLMLILGLVASRSKRAD